MNKIVCFYWQGDRWQDTTSCGPLPSDVSYRNHLNRVGSVSKPLATKYINNLYRGVKRFTTVPFEFICFTNEHLPALDPNITARSFKMVTSKGVLPRMYMFSTEAGLMGSQVLSLDLDVIITGPLDDLLNYNGPFCTRKSWTKGEETLLDGDIMSFRANETMEKLFWNPIAHFTRVIEEITQGRERLWVRYVLQGQINAINTWDEVAPGQICSYKYHIRPLVRKQYNCIPEKVNIISCHGHPRPHQIQDEWRMDYWK